MTAPDFLDVLEEIISNVVDPGAAKVDSTSSFPRTALTALGEARASAVMAPTIDALQEFIGRALCGMALFG